MSLLGPASAGPNFLLTASRDYNYLAGARVGFGGFAPPWSACPPWFSRRYGHCCNSDRQKGAGPSITFSRKAHVGRMTASCSDRSTEAASTHSASPFPTPHRSRRRGDRIGLAISE